MKKIVLKNIIMNFVLMLFFIILNNWTLQNSLEETFVFLALIYGLMVIIINALFVSRFNKK